MCLVLGWAAGSCGMDSDEVDELQAMAVARSHDERSDIQKLYDLIDQTGRLRDRPGVSEAERAALDAAASAARDAIAAYVDKHGQPAARAWTWRPRPTRARPTGAAVIRARPRSRRWRSAGACRTIMSIAARKQRCGT